MIARNRWTKSFSLLALAVVLPVCSASLAMAAAIEAKTADPKTVDLPGLGDPGKLVSLIVTPAKVLLSGSDDRRQLIVEGKYSSGQTRDLTASVQYKAAKNGVVSIDHGYLSPAGDGATG